MKLAEQLLKMHEEKREIIENRIINEDIDSALNDMARLVGPKGKFKNPVISKWLDKEGIKDDGATPINSPSKIRDELENWNYHTHTAIVDALIEGNSKGAEFLILVNDAHEKIGYMPEWLGNLRSLAQDDSFRERVLKNMEEVASGTFSGVGMRSVDVTSKAEAPSEYWKLLAKLPDSKISKRVEAMKELEKLEPMYIGVEYGSSDKATRMEISNAFHNLGRELRKKYTDKTLIKVGQVSKISGI